MNNELSPVNVNQNVPFSEELWQKGWQPVTRDGRLVRDLVKLKLSRDHLHYNFPFRGHLDQPYRWTVEGKGYWEKESDHDLFLIAPTT